MMETCLCDFCGLTITSDRGDMHQKGLDKVLDISTELDDGLKDKLSGRALPIPIHSACRKTYIKPSTITKRKRESESRDRGSIPKRRSQTPTIDIQRDCLYCGNPVQEYSGSQQRVPLFRRSNCHKAETKELLASVVQKADERNDEWGESVKLRVHCLGDLIAAEAVYHHDCQVRFHKGWPLKGQGSAKGGRPAGCVDAQKNNSFLKL
ncbi:hypothetical protein ACOMHN_011290 [Nucella lapillus]